MIDLDRVRKDTPACERLVHFNNAGAALIPTPVHQVVLEHLELERRIGGYEAAAEASDAVASFYTRFATLLGAQAHEIAAVENATRAWDMAFYSIGLKPGDRIITHASEYASNYLAFLQMANRCGVEIDVAPSDHLGQLDASTLPGLLSKRTRLIAITHVPSQSGLVNPAVEVGRFAAEHGLLYLLDACQSVGQMPVNVAEIGCHLLSGTGRKFLRGPRGTGFLYVDSNIIEQLEPPFIDLHSARWTAPGKYQWSAGARRFENWESHVAGRVGLARAVDYALDLGLDAIQLRLTELATSLRLQLADIDSVTVRDRGESLCAIVTFDKQNESPERLAARLRNENINISVTPASYAQLDLGARQLPAVARASPHYYNTAEEIERFCMAVAE